MSSFRQSMSWLHTWAGLVIGWVLFFMFVTGTAGYFRTEIDRWMQPELPRAQQVPANDALVLAERYLRIEASHAERWNITLPVDRNKPFLEVRWWSQGNRSEMLLDPESGHALEEARDTGGGELLYQMHYRLRYLPEIVADWIVVIATMFMLVAITTGVIVHRRIFADFFTFRPRKGQRSWLDAHNILAVVALPFHLMITYSGLIFYAATLMPLVIVAHYGVGSEGQRAFSDELNRRAAQVEPSGVAQPLTSLAPLLARAEARWGKGHARSLDIGNPGDTQARVEVRQIKSTPLQSTEALVFDGASGELLEVKPARHSTSKTVRDVFLGLHEGQFASPPLRWLYFISGLLGTAMIGTGLVLWTVKRRKKLEKSGDVTHRGLALVERLNVGTIVGLPTAIAAYFGANRLLPLGMGDRANWEANVMFIAWAAMLLHAARRPIARAWIKQTWIAAAACAFVPVLNALTTDRHLAVSLPQGDWVMAGFDLTMLAFGAAFACMAVMLMRRERAKPTTLQRKRIAPLPSRLMEPAE